MAVKFLSQEWADALTAQLNADPEFQQTAATATCTILQVIKGADGETNYWTKLADGKIEMGIGTLDGADATIRQSYDTTVALAKRELSPVTGFMMGKIKVEGNMGLLLSLQGVLTKIADAMGTMDVDY